MAGSPRRLEAFPTETRWSPAVASILSGAHFTRPSQTNVSASSLGDASRRTASETYAVCRASSFLAGGGPTIRPIRMSLHREVLFRADADSPTQRKECVP
jgi:hypothetical protein